VAELGIIAAGGVCLCAATAFIVLPALVAIADRRRDPSTFPTPFQGKLLVRLTQTIPGRVVGVAIVVLILLACSTVTITEDGIQPRVTYDSNLLNLQADDVESVQLLNRIFDETQGSLLYAVSITDSPLKARMLAQEYRALPTVGRVEELASYLPAYPSPETRLLIQGFHSQLEHLSSLPREFPGLDPLSIGRGLEELYLSLKDRTEVDAVAAAHKLDEFLNELERIPVAAQVEVLSNYQYGMLSSLQGQLTALADLADDEPVSPDDFAEPVRSRFVSDQGRWLVRVYPKSQIWDAEPLEAFVNDVRSVDPDVTGTPLQNHEAARSIKESYLHAALYAAIVITLVLLTHVLSLRTIALSVSLPVLVVVFAIVMSGGLADISWNTVLIVYITLAVAVSGVLEPRGMFGTLIALMPPVLGTGAMFGILALMGQDLNPANMIVLPLILGIGVDNGVHAYHDFRGQRRGRYRMASSVISAITLNSMTTMIGFGSMMVADHRGLASLGLVLAIGVGSCLSVAMLPLPALLTLVSRRMGRKFGEPDESLEGTVSLPSNTAIADNGLVDVDRTVEAERLPKAG
jgi:predicted RND superfamily exporter protein